MPFWAKPALRDQGWAVHHKRVLPLMQQDNFLCLQARLGWQPVRQRQVREPDEDAQAGGDPQPRLADLEAHMCEFFDRYYNRRRLHSALGYRTPEQFEHSLLAQPVLRAGGQHEFSEA